MEHKRAKSPSSRTPLRPRGRGRRLCWRSLRGHPNEYNNVSPTAAPAPAAPAPSLRREPPLGSPSFPQLLPLSHTKEIRRQKKLWGLGQKQRTEREKDRGLAPKCHLGVWELPRRAGQLPVRLGGSWVNSVGFEQDLCGMLHFPPSLPCYLVLPPVLSHIRMLRATMPLNMSGAEAGGKARAQRWGAARSGACPPPRAADLSSVGSPGLSVLGGRGGRVVRTTR